MNNGNSRLIFVLDLVVIYTAFYGTYYYYNGHAMIPFRAMLLMGFIALMWFLISINSRVVRINRRSKVVPALKDILVAYSVLSAAVIAAVATFGNFRPNDKLILYPLLFAVIWSTTFRLIYIAGIKHLIKNGFQQKTVLLIGGGRVAERVMNLVLSFPEYGYRLHWILADDYHAGFFQPGDGGCVERGDEAFEDAGAGGGGHTGYGKDVLDGNGDPAEGIDVLSGITGCGELPVGLASLFHGTFRV